MKNLLVLMVAFVGLASYQISAEETVKEKMEEAGRDFKRGSAKAVRNVKDESCELVNGKMECAGKKAKHSIQNGSDKLEDAID